MKQFGTTRSILCATSLAATAVGWAQLRPLLSRWDEHARSGNIAQILLRSQAISRALGESDEMADFRTYSGLLFRSDGSRMQYLSVHIEPRQRGGDLVLDWDAGSGELISLRHSAIEPARSVFSVLSRQEAARLSLSWLHTLGV